MSLQECIRGELEKGATYAQARKHCARTYGSKATPGVRYKSVVPGAKTTPGRLSHEQKLLKRKRQRKRRAYQGIPIG